MKFSDIRVLEGSLVSVADKQIDEFTERFWINFPNGYREFITTFGEGILGGDLVRIYPPWRIEKELTEWRRRINKFWLWDEEPMILPKERALECIIIGDTLNGDELVFHPSRPSQLFVLPQESEKVFLAGNNLLSAIEWMCDSGELVEPFSERNFVPFDSRASSEQQDDTHEKVDDPEGETLDELVELCKEWTKRHSVKKQLKESLKEYNNKDKKASRIFEAFVIEGEYPFLPGYLAEYNVIDKKSGLEIGTLHWHMNEDSSGYDYSPNHANVEKLRNIK